MIVIIKGCGTNIASVQFALERLGKKSLVTNHISDIQSASHVILPGVGTAKKAMDQLQKFKLIELITGLKQPVLGICLGMQILFEFSFEGLVPCLNRIPGKIKKLSDKKNLTFPHMGWNQIEIKEKNSPLLNHIQNKSYVYFAHSFFASVSANTVATATYGETFSAIVQHTNFYGVQFHPERSGRMGQLILKNFLDLK